MRILSVTALVALTLSAPVRAGDQIIYNSAPDWVDPSVVETSERSSNSAIVLLDHQARIEDGQLWTYLSTAIALDSPQALTQFGTVSAQWLPDKGDLIVHSVELLRAGEVIDLLADGAEFEILRREQGLESRLLNGVLTATMTVPGAQLGDIVRMSYSTTLSDQALGENSQWEFPLFARPFPLENGRVSISWPQDEQVSRMRIGDADIAEPEVRDGYYFWTANIPLDERDPVPSDAPFRYQLGDVMQVTTYSDWADVSQSMAQHFGVEGAVTPGGELAEVIAGVAMSSDDPLERAALALQLVQDDISYLLNGLNGGNYLPQSPEETWENRFGDCKAKSLLLLAMLRELGIDAEVVLVSSQGGDSVPLLAPMPANFDHMIVRAEIGGTNYWLDGTTAGTRLDTIDEVPRFFYALPLRDEGAELIKLDTRPQATPDWTVQLSIDQSAGIRLPGLFDIEVEYRGDVGAQWRTVADQGDEDVRDNAVTNIVSRMLGGMQLLDRAVTYDPTKGIATLSARGILQSQWERDRNVYEFVGPTQAAKDVNFEADRARAAWRDIPMRLNGPIYWTSEVEVRLPDDSGPFEMKGVGEVAETIGGIELSSSASLNGNIFFISQKNRTIDEELAAADIPGARRSLVRLGRSLPSLRSSDQVREPWEYFGDDRARLEPLESAYAEAVAESEPDDPTALLSRAYFRTGVFDHAGALADTEAAYAIEASRDLYLLRAYLKQQVGDLDGALEDTRLAEDLDPNGSTLSSQIQLLALLGRPTEGLELAEEYRQIVDNPVSESDVLATALGWSGSSEEGMEELEGLAASRPGDGTLLNAICWYAGTWDLMTSERLETCVEGVEKSNYSAAALDSRALAHFRMGDFDAAKTDIDAALELDPSLAESRLLRGIIRVAQGDRDGRAEIELALMMRPAMRAVYEAWGLEF